MAAASFSVRRSASHTAAVLASSASRSWKRVRTSASRTSRDDAPRAVAARTRLSAASPRSPLRPEDLERLGEERVVLGGAVRPAPGLLSRVRGHGVRPHPGAEGISSGDLDLPLDGVPDFGGQRPSDGLVLGDLRRGAQGEQGRKCGAEAPGHERPHGPTPSSLLDHRDHLTTMRNEPRARDRVREAPGRGSGTDHGGAGPQGGQRILTFTPQAMGGRRGDPAPVPEPARSRQVEAGSASRPRGRHGPRE